jgi:hypothetical protein
MPGVALDQNQQIHIRDQHNDGQYRINRILMPLDLYAEPAFVDFINPMFIKQVDLLTGILPAQYGFSDIGGVIDIQTKDGFTDPGGTFTMYGGQLAALQSAADYDYGTLCPPRRPTRRIVPAQAGKPPHYARPDGQAAALCPPRRASRRICREAIVRSRGLSAACRVDWLSVARPCLRYWY